MTRVDIHAVDIRLPCWKFPENEQIASRASWSVSAGWIPIGNHFPVCFLKVSTHQKQKLTHSVSGCLDAFNNKESKRVREGTNMLWERKIASILEILWSRLTGRSMYFDDVAPSIKSTDSKRNLFFFFQLFESRSNGEIYFHFIIWKRRSLYLSIYCTHLSDIYTASRRQGQELQGADESCRLTICTLKITKPRDVKWEIHWMITPSICDVWWTPEVVLWLMISCFLKGTQGDLCCACLQVQNTDATTALAERKQ